MIFLKYYKGDTNILNRENLTKRLGESKDIVIRDIYLNGNVDLKVSLFYIDGLVNLSDISNFILKPLVKEQAFVKAADLKDVLKQIENGKIYNASQSITDDLDKTINQIMSGCSVLLLDKIQTAVIFETKKFDKRSITEPTIESTTKGPKDSFIENYRSNTATIRRKIKNPELMIKDLTIGKQTQTTLGVFYLGNIVNDTLVKEVFQRLESINVDNLLTTSFIEAFLSEDPLCTFPQVGTTERPDSFCADIIEGRVGIIVDGIPIGFVVPGTLVQFMQTSEEYSRNTIIASAIRAIRFTCLFLSLVLPGLFIAISTYHPEMIPTNLALFIAKSREGVTFPVAIETILMLAAFEILFEAGLRIPKNIGQAVSIVGTLVVGQAAVEAKLVSPSIVVMIAMTIITSFAMPNQDFSNSVRIWRIIFTIFSAVLGLIGIVIASILFVFKLAQLESFGVPYLSPFVSNNGKTILQDSIFSFPLKSNKYRPKILNTKNNKRVGD